MAAAGGGTAAGTFAEYPKYDRLIKWQCDTEFRHMWGDPAVGCIDLHQSGVLAFAHAVDTHKFNAFSTHLFGAIRNMLGEEQRRLKKRGVRPSLSSLVDKDDDELALRLEAPVVDTPFNMQQLMVRVSPLARQFVEAFANPCGDVADHMNKVRSSGVQFFARVGRKLGFNADEIKSVRAELKNVLPKLLAC